MHTTRRDFLRSASAVAMGFAGLRAAFPSRAFASGAAGTRTAPGFGPLVPDPLGALDLPAGFTYRTFSPVGTPMADGLLVPGKHDGMAAFRGERGRVILMRNHELDASMTRLSPFGPGHERVGLIDRSLLFDRTPTFGGVTAVEFDEDACAMVRQNLALAGTQRNCSGGPTPWGSWISCEEDDATRSHGFERDHGWCFEVPAVVGAAPVDPIPLTAMGRFYHEAVAVDPRTSIVYLTEDREDGMLYRFIPNEPGKLAKGGRLQALAVVDRPSLDTRNWAGTERVPVGERLPCRWIDLDGIDSPSDDLRYRGVAAGAARVGRGEGAWFGGGAVYVACTDGGPKHLGQIWKYRPSGHEGGPDEHRSPGELELWVESDDGTILENCDNLTVAPWGDVIVCEDGAAGDRVLGITPDGGVYTIAAHTGSTGEVAGVCFSPSGRTLFFNLQDEGLSVAVQGPWPRT